MTYKVVGTDGRCYGPVPAEVLRQWLTEHRVNAQTLVQEEGSSAWRPLSAVGDFASDFAQAAPLAAPPQMAASYSDPRASTKIPAGVCGILLGSLGVHKFILGYTGAGLVMLLVSVLTCFMAAPVMGIIGLIEGILYLTRSDAEFVRTYVEGSKPWF
jgi:TM2 domain-containing membrane protein YozV